jgi:hypothetical protein
MHDHLVVRLAQQPRDRSGFDELRPVADDRDDSHGVSYSESEMTKLFGGTVGLAAAVARHVAWYVSHQVQADPRDRA